MSVHFEKVMKEDLWLCDKCGEGFDQRIWHCPWCHHHWLMDEDECRNCYLVKRRGNGVLVSLCGSRKATKKQQRIFWERVERLCEGVKAKDGGG